MSKHIKMGLYDGTPPTFTHGKGHLADQHIPSPSEHADKGSKFLGTAAGKGDGMQHLGTGHKESSGSIEHVPMRKGPGKSMGMGTPKPKGLDAPFGSTKTKPT